jgi:hypothetical protein
MLSSYDKELLHVEDRGEEMALGGELMPEIVGCIDARVDRPANPALGLVKSGAEFRKTNSPHDHEVKIALGSLERA